MSRLHNSTIIRKKKICKLCGREAYIFSKGRCQPCATSQDTLTRIEEEEQKFIKEESLGDLIKDADAIFSQYIRLKYADKNGWVKCFTCSEIKHWTLMQCGHFIKRGHLLLRFDERNSRPQDVYCNEGLSGNLPIYRVNLEIESPGLVDILEEEMRLVNKPTRYEITQIISEYSSKVKELKKKKL